MWEDWEDGKGNSLLEAVLGSAAATREGSTKECRRRGAGARMRAGAAGIAVVEV